MRIVRSPWPRELSVLVASARKTLRIAAPYFGEGVIRTVLKKSKRSTDKSFLFALSEQGIRNGSQSAMAIRLLQTSPECAVKIAKNLHAKIIIADQHSAIVTSSNLTRAGLSSNAEVGVYVDEPNAVKLLINEFDRWYGQAGEVEDEILDQLESIRRKSKLTALGKRYGKKLLIGRVPSHAAPQQNETVGWILVHSHARFNNNDAPQDELGKQYKGLWHWTRNNPMKAGKGYQLLLAWNGEIFGESAADITQRISKRLKAEGYNFAFDLKNYKEGKRAVPIDRIVNLRHYRDLVRLDAPMLKKYRQLASK